MSRLEMAMFMLPGLMIGLTFHEFAHAWVASLLGDDYPRRQGRVSLNPFRHLSLLGTLAMFVVHFGWGKPVMINLYNFKHPRRDFLLSSLAGPAANLIVVAACMIAMQFTRNTYLYGANATYLMERAHTFLFLLALINAILATINLLPVPPLDGSKIWPCLIPALKPSFGRKTTWIFVILLIVAVRTNSLSPVFDVAIDTVRRILPTSDSERFYEQFHSGRLAVKQQRYADADKTLTEALAVNPWSDEALYERMIARTGLDRHDDALADIDRAIELWNYDANYYDARAALLDHFNRPAEAKRDRHKADELRRRAAGKQPNAQATADGGDGDDGD